MIATDGFTWVHKLEVKMVKDLLDDLEPRLKYIRVRLSTSCRSYSSQLNHVESIGITKAQQCGSQMLLWGGQLRSPQPFLRQISRWF